MAAFTDEQAEARKRQKTDEATLRREQAERDEFVRAALDTQQGRTYFRWLLAQTGYPHVNPAATPPEAMAFRCGVLSVGQVIGAHLLETVPEALIRLLKDPYDARPDSDSRTGPLADPEPDADSESLSDSGATAEPAAYYN